MRIPHARRPLESAARIAGCAVAIVVAVGLTGCASHSIDDPASSESPSASASASATASATATSTTADIAFSARPAQAGALSCGEVLPAGLTAALVPGLSDDDPLTALPHVGLATLAVIDDGGVVCNEDDGATGGLAGQGRATRITATVLPDAAAELAALLDDPTMAEPVSCAASAPIGLTCHADVHAGSAWLRVDVDRAEGTGGVTAGTMEDRFEALVTQAAAVVARSPVGSAAVPHGQGIPGPSTCTADRVNAAVATPLADAYAARDYQVDVEWVALARAGGEGCAFVASGAGPDATTSARYGTLPGGSWVVAARIDAGLIDARDRVDLGGLGAGDAAFRTCDATQCTVDVVHNGDWTQYALATSATPDTRAAVATWARASFGH